MGSQAHHTRSVQRKVVTALLVVTTLLLLVSVPLVINDDLRLNVAQRLSLVPGSNAEQLADADDGAMLVVVPIQDRTESGKPRTLYKAQFIGWPVAGGTELTDIDSDRILTIPVREVDFIAANPKGTHILFRGQGADGKSAVLVNTQELTAETLPDGESTPAIEGDWDVPVWATSAGLCDRYSPEKKFVACFNRADAASYLAGDWQIDVQRYGNFEAVEPLYRGQGFLLPMVGFARHDTWLYFQSEHGIWRIEIPVSLQAGT